MSDDENDDDEGNDDDDDGNENNNAVRSPAVSPIAFKRGKVVSSSTFVSPALVAFKVALLSLLAVPVCYGLNYTSLVDDSITLMVTGIVVLIAVLVLADRAIFSSMPWQQYDFFMVRTIVLRRRLHGPDVPRRPSLTLADPRRPSLTLADPR